MQKATTIFLNNVNSAMFEFISKINVLQETLPFCYRKTGGGEVLGTTEATPMTLCTDKLKMYQSIKETLRNLDHDVLMTPITKAKGNFEPLLYKSRQILQ